ncbi:MAG: chitobiase/beta-hexosaminidase C-terminal domain-containing protein, partial [Phycisphaerales bacterium]
MRPLLALITVFLGAAWTSLAQPIQVIDLGDQRFEIAGEPLALDLDADGTADSVCRPSPCSPELVGVYLASGEGVEFSTSSRPSRNALALNAGDNVADAFTWFAFADLLANCGYSGEWQTPRTAFVGYRVLGNPVRYGWIRVTNTDGTARGFIFHNAAFDTAGGRILAGEDNSRTISPRLDPPGGTYSNVPAVTVSTPTDHAEIRYTLDGSIPGPDSPMVANGGTVQVTESGTTLRVAATSPNLPPSYLRAETYTLECATPRLSPLYGRVPVRVSIESPTTDAIIRYSTDGSDPLPPHGEVYTGPLDIQTPTLLRAIATKPGFINSGIAQAQYRLTDIVYQRADGR